MDIKITKAEDWNWYNVGEEYTIRDYNKYGEHGIQVVNGNLNETRPDVVNHGHFVKINR